MATAELIVYATTWCGDCRRARALLERYQIPHTWIDVDQDKEAEALVRRLNNGYRSVPTLIFPDGSRLVEPSDAALAEKLGLPA